MQIFIKEIKVNNQIIINKESRNHIQSRNINYISYNNINNYNSQILNFNRTINSKLNN